MGSRVFLSPETQLYFVKTYIIHALAETTSEAHYISLKTTWPHWYVSSKHLRHWMYAIDRNEYTLEYMLEICDRFILNIACIV